MFLLNLNCHHLSCHGNETTNKFWEATADRAKITTRKTKLTFSQRLCSLLPGTGYFAPHNPQNCHTCGRGGRPVSKHADRAESTANTKRNQPLNYLYIFKSKYMEK